MPDSLLATKLYAPPLRPELVDRPRLLERMAHGLHGGARLTLVTAPAGYGKTTLALAWLQSLGRPYGWLSLDGDDNQPVQFLAYLRAALQPALGGEAPEAAAMPEAASPSAGADRLQAPLRALINRLAAHPHPFVLALDDYHVITEVAVHDLVAYLLDHLPPQVHVVITTRQDPLLPLSRLRSRSQLTEIRLGELRFSVSEADHFLNQVLKLGLAPPQVADLAARTEGWIAGLQLAALSLSSMAAVPEAGGATEQRAQYIAAFTGDDRHVMDYLTDEVLSHQPAAIKRFLLHTSVLKRLTGPLCDAVLADDGPAGPPRPSALVLEELERANLFVIPLDNRREWYRYHHLFVDLLSSRLQAADPALVAALHGRASRWYETAGLFGEAVDHALLAEDFDRALRLMEHTAQTSLWASGDLPVLLNWSRRLPAAALQARPRLCLYLARGLFLAGQVEAAEHHLRAAEQVLEHRSAALPGGDELWGILYTNQATIHAMRGDSATALALARQAQARVPVSDASTQARIGHAVGMAAFLQGDVAAAQAAFTEAGQLARRANNHFLGLDVAACLALTLVLAGRLRQAEQVCRAALPPVAGEPLPAAGAVYLALAHVQFARHALGEAQAALDLSLQLGRKANWPHVLWQAHLLQAQVFHASGLAEAAAQAMAQAERAAARYPLPRVAQVVAAGWARLAVATGDNAAPWAEAYAAQARTGLCDFEELTLAGVWLAQGQPAQALTRLDELLEQATAASRLATVIEGRVLQALALQALGQTKPAREALLAALRLAAPEGFTQVFLDAGPAVAAVLAEAQHRPEVPAPVAAFIEQLLSGLPPAAPLSAPPDAGTPVDPAPQPAALIEPLSKRELEVLALIAEGLSNPEIARRLYLSVNTLRAHTTNIYQKLDVHSRVQAVTRAQALGLLPLAP